MVQQNYNVMPAEDEGTSNSALWAVVVLLVILVLGYLLFIGGRDNQPNTTIQQENNQPATETPAPTNQTPTTPETPTTPTQ